MYVYSICSSLVYILYNSCMLKFVFVQLNFFIICVYINSLRVYVQHCSTCLGWSFPVLPDNATVKHQFGVEELN